MSNQISPTPDLQPLADKLWAKVKELQKERKEAFAKNEERIRQHPPRFDCDRGSAEAAEIAEKIETLIEAGQLLGLIDPNVDPVDYF